MSKILVTAALGAVSILFLAGLGVGQTHVAPVSYALPAIAHDAATSEAPRECSTARNVTTACTYP
jgi:hypothetical protein